MRKHTQIENVVENLITKCLKHNDSPFYYLNLPIPCIVFNVVMGNGDGVVVVVVVVDISCEDDETDDC